MTKRFSLIAAMRDVINSLAPPAVLLILHLLRQAIWPVAIAFDVAAHFLGGLAIAWSALLLWKRWTARGWISGRTPTWLRDYVLITTAGLAGIMWEFMEWILDYLLPIITQPSLTDTMNDLFMDLLGAVIFIALMRLRQKR